MIADYNSKQLQGFVFVRLRNMIMGVRKEDFSKCKENYIVMLKKYDLYDKAEEDLFAIWFQTYNHESVLWSADLVGGVSNANFSQCDLYLL